MELLEEKRMNNQLNGKFVMSGGGKAKLSNNYLQTGSVHGLKHLENQRKCQKIFWYLVITIAFFCTILSLATVLTREESITKAPIHEIPFPAITICPETKAQKSVIDISKAYHRLVRNATDEDFSGEDLSRIEALTQVCDPHLFSTINVSHTPTPGEKFVEILRQVAVPQSKMILFCKYRNELVECGELFKEIVTDDGICYSFNLLSNGELFSEDEYRYESPKSRFSADYPYRALANQNYGLNVVLSLSTTDLDFICKGPVQGFKVRLHAPAEHPNMADGYMRIPLNSDIIVSVHARVDESSSSDCHTAKSKPLKLFKNYSQRNCIAECLTKHQESSCGCSQFSRVHDNQAKICSQQKTQCLVEAAESFFVHNRIKERFLCDCKPSCVNYEYDLSESEATFDFNRVFGAYNESLEEEFPAAIMSRLNVYMKEDFYVHTRHYDGAFNQFITVISQFGGIMAFFLGTSIISVIELLYLATLKLTKCFTN